MKKILKIVLVVFTCVCLVNIAKNNAKAEETNGTEQPFVTGYTFRQEASDYITAKEKQTQIPVTQIEFKETDTLPTTDCIDLSVGSKKTIMGVVDEDTFYVYVKTGDKIKFNTNSDHMFMAYNGDKEPLLFNRIESIDFNNCVDTSEVTNLTDMFYGCNALKSLYLSDFDTSKVTSMEGMFCECYNLEDISFGDNFKSDALLNTKSMFANCWSLKRIDFQDGFTCASVKDMEKMFSTCLSLTSLNLKKFDTTNVENTKGMFQGCIFLNRIYVPSSDLKFNKVTSETSTNMFKRCDSLFGQDGTAFDEDHTDKTYARIGKSNEQGGQPGYFTDTVTEKTSTVKCDANGVFRDGAGAGDPITGISYDNDTKIVTMNGLVLDSEVNGKTLVLPSGTKEVVVTGNNLINNVRSMGTGSEFVLSTADENAEIKFTGKGSLVINNTVDTYGFECGTVIINGPKINISTNVYSSKTNAASSYGAALYANKVIVNSGSLNILGTIGIQLNQSEDKDGFESKPSFVVNGGSILAKGSQSAFLETLSTEGAVKPVGLVKGTSSLIDSSLSSNIKLDIVNNDAKTYRYVYFDSYGDVVRTISITPNPSPDPGKKDESCEKVIGPTWHWNNDKGICEDYGVVGTSTR